MIAASVVVAATASLVTVLGGALLLRLPVPALAGIVSGMQTQPAVLAYASEQHDDDTDVNVGYATVVPLAMIDEDRARTAPPPPALVTRRATRSAGATHAQPRLGDLGRAAVGQVGDPDDDVPAAPAAERRTA